MDSASREACGGTRGRICGLLCGSIEARDGWRLATRWIVGSSPTSELDSGKPTIDWEESGAGYELRSLHISVIKMSNTEVVTEDTLAHSLTHSLNHSLKQEY